MLRGITLALCLSLISIPTFAINVAAHPAKGESAGIRVKATVTTQRFSVSYPDHWMVTRRDGDFVIIYNQRPPEMGGGEAPPYMIKTDVSFQPTSLREALADYTRDPERVRKIEEVTVNGRLGVRIWEESEGWDFRNSLITYIPVSDREVAYVISFYSLENQYAEQAIIQMQNTFKLF